MNAEIIWLQWQALGCDVPIEVCELLVEVEASSGGMDLCIAPSGWRSLGNAKEDTIVWHNQPQPLDEGGMTRLALFCWRLHTVNQSSTQRFQLCENARGWWLPIVQRCHAEGRAL